MTSKQRAYLKSLAMDQSAILQIGKSSLTPEITRSVDEALEARELIKIHVLKNCFDDGSSIAEVLAERTRAEVVQVIGKMIVLYRPAKEEKKRKKAEKKEKKEKKDLLLHLLKNPEIESVLIFTRTKHGADKLAKILNKSEIGAEAIHGNKSQNARQRALTNFKDHTTRVLIATDIAARGIDVNQLSHVINYELPNISETYVHRIGRTGRAGHDGIAISFCESEELPYLKDIQKLIGLQIPVVKDHPWVTVEGVKAQAGKTEELKEKAKANKAYRGNKSNGDYWRRKKQAQSRQGQGRQSSDRKASGRQG